MEPVEIRMGEYKVGQAPSVLSTGGVGSCIVVCLYCFELRKGAMAHVMLPGTLDSTNETDFRFADAAIKAMLRELEREQVPANRLISKVVGGANMFPSVQGRSAKVGERNIESVHELLAAYGITIAGEETGGTGGRAVVFDLSNGIVTIKMTL